MHSERGGLATVVYLPVRLAGPFVPGLFLSKAPTFGFEPFSAS